MRVWGRFVLLVACLCAGFDFNANAAPPRLAVVNLAPEGADAEALLGAELSKAGDVALVERSEIDRVLAEQRLAAAKGDYAKLGQMLGADGLWLVEAGDGGKTALNLRLVAVKQGVALAGGTLPAGTKDVAGWATRRVQEVRSLLPKLQVPPKDAAPLSVVNFRCSLNTAASAEMERQLKVLVIQRLTSQPEIFVLERQRMDLLGEEKVLNADSSPFWGGSHLLEGALDRDGYSAETVTLDATLTPAKGGAPEKFQLKAARTNLTALAEQLGSKVAELLKVSRKAEAWKPQDEARRYYEEAQWALKWKLHRAAQSAADAAWALGKQDEQAAIARVLAYAEPDTFKELRRGAIKMTLGNYRDLILAADAKPPEVETLSRFAQALELYLDFGRSIAPGELKFDSPWTTTGVKILNDSSIHLQHCWLATNFANATDGPAARLRERTRNVAAVLAELPCNRLAFRPAAGQQLMDETSWSDYAKTNVFSTMVQWGMLWQDHPEDTVRMYQGLMESPIFARFHNLLWDRTRATPLYLVWNQGDATRSGVLWEAFIKQLEGSTNFLLQMEGAGLRLAGTFPLEPTYEEARKFDDDGAEIQWEEQSEKLFSIILSQKDQIASHAVDLMYNDWGLNTLFAHFHDQSESTVKMGARYKKEIAPRISEMRKAWKERESNPLLWYPGLGQAQAAEKYFLTVTNFDEGRFQVIFRVIFDKASEFQSVLPSLEIYKSNYIVAQKFDKSISPGAKKGTLIQIEMLERVISQAAPKAGQPKTPSILSRPPEAPTPFGPPAQLANVQGRQQNTPDVDSAVAAAKKYFLSTTSFNPQGFLGVVTQLPMSPEVARQVLPSLLIFKSNCVAAYVNSKEPRDARAPSPAVFIEQFERGFVQVQSTPAVSAPPVGGPLSATFPAVAGAAENKPSVAALKVRGFRQIPGEGGGNEGTGSLPKLFLHRMFGDQLLLLHRAAEGNQVSICDLKSFAWRQIPIPTAFSAEQTLPGVSLGMTTDWNPGELFALHENRLVVSAAGVVRYFDLNTSQWSKTSVPQTGNRRLFVVGGGLFGVDDESIVKLGVGETKVEVVASRRRRSADNPLDQLESFGKVRVVQGLNGGLRAVSETAIYTLSGARWSETPLRGHLWTVHESGGFVVLRQAYQDIGITPDTVSILPRESLDVQVAVQDSGRMRSFSPVQTERNRVETTWNSWPGGAVGDNPDAMWKSNVCVFIMDRGSSRDRREMAPAQPGSTDAKRLAPTLVVFASGVRDPLAIPLQFDPNAGPLPVQNGRRNSLWLEVGAEHLLIGGAQLPGFWAVPIADLADRLASARGSVERKETP